MTTVVINPPPEPPVGRDWCAVCLMLAKGKQVPAAMRAEIDRLSGDGKRHAKHVIPFPEHAQLNPAEYQALADGIENCGIMGVCWLHIAGMTPAEPASPQIPRGLIRGRGLCRCTTRAATRSGSRPTGDLST